MTLTRQQSAKAGRSKDARARKQLSVAEYFFYQHAGYSYDPETETPEQGRIRCAKHLAYAESYRLEHCWEIEWQDEEYGVDHQKEFGYQPQSCECALLRNDEGRVVASLGCIDDADANYRRVIEAELAEETIGNIKERLDAQREAIQHMN